ncbi:ricin-type beta-trefoil lectin domain protein [Catenulispora rubra]|uniref:ricin-type beta-trefoil lectin domain protein n=1 Tax=Catenulispora rubra TaxID=280293 RepID=UPI0018924FDD|nr:ricin-type beta-trefoil lectin domain protein [Catenulispora rubra]
MRVPRPSVPAPALALALALALTTTLCTALTSTLAAAPARAFSLPADGGSHRSPHTLGLTYATVPASTLLCAKVAAKAGYSFNRTVATSLGQEPQIVVAIAVAMAESSCNPSAVNINSGGSEDRGLWQMNSVYHSEVSKACAFQIQCNANAAWRVSNHGADWNPWSAYANGSWRSFVGDARAAISGGFSFQLANSGGRTCLDADRGNHADGAPIRQWVCNAGDAYQQWTVVSSAVGALPILRNVGAGTCLDWDGSKVGNGQPIFQSSCDSADGGQQFSFVGGGQMNTDGSAQALMQNSHDGTCVDADRTDHADGAPIRQWTCNGSDGFQMWN